MTQGQIDLDSVMAGYVSGVKHHGVDEKHLLKIWCIDHDTAKRTLDVTSKLSVRKNDPKLSRNYGTKDCMLRCKRIKTYFLMDTFFATKKQVNPLEEILVVNYLLLTKGLYLLSQ